MNESFASRFILDDRQVHVWQADLDLDESRLRECREILSDSERARAVNFKFESDRSRWIAARANLRRLVSRYLNLPPAQIEFHVSESGKPFVLTPVELEFNLSHSGNVALYAFSRKPVGIDVEALRDVPDALAIASRYFPEQESKAVAKCSAEERSAAFLRRWVRHEAVAKAQGAGLAGKRSLTSVSRCDEWTIVEVTAPDGYVAALAMPPSFAIEYPSWPAGI